MKTSTIQGFPNYTINELGEIKNATTGLSLKIHVSSSGYPSVRLYYAKNESKLHYLHRLLMIHFTPNPDNHSDVNHIDGNKLNNSLSNLEWCNRAHNIKHSYDSGLRTFTEKQRKALDINRSKNKGKGKLILNKETGVYYTGVAEAVESIPNKICLKYFAMKLSGNSKNNTPFIYA